MSQEEYNKNIDRIFRLPRVWSNRELQKFAHLFDGDIVNVSGWKDIDKEGKEYKDYFTNKSSYTVTNYKSEARGFQGGEHEIFLNLENDLSNELNQKFDVVFNHTVLEHIYKVDKAFENICKMTKDIAIVVVPFLQVMHADYGDYWRFTPLAMGKMFKENQMEMIYCSFNSHKNSSVYLFCIATKNKEKWIKRIPESTSYVDPFLSGNLVDNWIGSHAIDNSAYVNKNDSFLKKLKKKFSKYVK